MFYLSFSAVISDLLSYYGLLSYSGLLSVLDYMVVYMVNHGWNWPIHYHRRGHWGNKKFHCHLVVSRSITAGLNLHDVDEPI